MEQIYFKNTFVSIYYDKDLCLGKAVWKGDLTGTEYKEAALICLDLIDRHGLKGWIGDNRKMKSIRPDDLKWSFNVFMPKLLAGPLLRLANLPSEDEQNRKAVDAMCNKAENPDELLIRNFKTEEEALTWLYEIT